MIGSNSKINNTDAAVFITVAAVIDGIQFFVGFLDVIFLGTPINIVIDIFTWLGFYIAFKIKGVDFVKPKRGLSFAGSLLVKCIPFLNMLPAWTAMVLIIVGSMRAEEIAAKAGVPAPIIKTVGKGK